MNMQTHYSDKLNQFNKFSEQLYDQFIVRMTSRRLILAVAALVLGLGMQRAYGQSFDPPQTNPFGMTNTYAYTFPRFVDIDGDGDFDVFVGDDFNNNINNIVKYFENTGTNTSPVFTTPQTNPFGLDTVKLYTAPGFVDIDGDGDFDVFMGLGAGDLQYFENTGTKTAATFAAPLINPFGFQASFGSTASSFVDIDGDGDFDLFVANSGGLRYFENGGTKTAPAFIGGTQFPFGLPFGFYAAPVFVDIDKDGDFDFFLGEPSGELQYFENIGTNTAPAFDTTAQVNPFGLSSVNNDASPEFVDIDGDGDFDVFVGEDGGDLQYFENVSPTNTGIEDNDLSTNVSIYPNPTKTNFNISIQGKNELGEVTLKVTNSIGQTMLKEKNNVSAKVYSKEINTDEFAKGLYFVRLSTNDHSIISKLIVQ